MQVEQRKREKGIGKGKMKGKRKGKRERDFVRIGISAGSLINPSENIQLGTGTVFHCATIVGQGRRYLSVCLEGHPCLLGCSR